MKKRFPVIVGLTLLGVLAVALAPLVVAAATAPDIISVMNGVVNGILSAGRDAYCALGVDAMC